MLPLEKSTSKWKEYLFMVLVFNCILTSYGTFVPPNFSEKDCKSYRSVLVRTVVQYCASYFADNPRPNQSRMNFTDDTILSPDVLFRVFYGQNISTKNFKQALLHILYSDPGPSTISQEDADRIVLRNNIYKFAIADSFRLAREKFGLLLYLGITDYTMDSAEWASQRCLNGEELITRAESVINDELERLRFAIGEYKFGLFFDLAIGTSLSLVVDTNMRPDLLEAVKRRAELIVEKGRSSNDPHQDFVLITFYRIAFSANVTRDPQQFRQVLNRYLTHQGVYNWPQNMMRSLLLAVENSRQGSTVIAISNNEAKDIELQDQVISQAINRNVKISFFLPVNGRIQSTICSGNPMGSVQRQRCSMRSLKYGQDLYEFIAENTGGDVIVLREDEFIESTSETDRIISQGIVKISHHYLQGNTSTIVFDIDSSISEVILKYSCVADRALITFNGTSRRILNLMRNGNLREEKMLVEDRFGRWAISFMNRRLGDCFVEVSGISTKDFIINIAKQKQFMDSPPLLEIIEGQPLLSERVFLLINGVGQQTEDKILLTELICRDGRTNPIDRYRVNSSTKELSDEIRVQLRRSPTCSFYVKIQGTDENGFQFTRLSSSLLVFVNTEIGCVDIETIVLRPGIATQATFFIHNYNNSSVRLEVGISDSQGYVTEGLTSSAFTIRGNIRRTFTFNLMIGNSASFGTTSIVTITAANRLLNYLLFKTCRIVVGQSLRPTVESVAIRTSISSRFAQTDVTTVLFNNASVSREAEFLMVLPADAFIHRFSLTIDDQVYHASIMDRQRARAIYNVAKERGFTAGFVRPRERSMNVFQTSVNLEPFKSVMFNLTYQELLTKKNQRYTYGVSLYSSQPLKQLSQFSIDVSICESSEIVDLAVHGIGTDQSVLPYPVDGITVTRTGGEGNTAYIYYRPTYEMQTQYSPLGLNGRFTFDYELQSSQATGELIASGRDFVHFVSPDIEPMPKRVVFVLDVSGSMFGNKFRQLKLAMCDILDDLWLRDEFSIVLFNDETTTWNLEENTRFLLPATSAFKSRAKAFLESVTPKGGTDILQGVLQALQLLDLSVRDDRIPDKPVGGVEEITSVADYILLLTDGRSTDGVVDSNTIASSILEMNSNHFGIHTIGFGPLVDEKMLQTIAAQNSGTSVQIFAEIDTHIQMSDFFSTISRPLFDSIGIDYPSDRVYETTDTRFPSLYGGRELTTVGRFRGDEISAFPVTVTGQRRDRRDTFSDITLPKDIESMCSDDVFQSTDIVQRFGEFFRLRNLLREIAATSSPTDRATLRDQARAISLENHIVAPGVTSLIVLQPGDLQSVEEILEEDEDEDSLESISTTTPPDASTTTGTELAGQGGVFRRVTAPTLQPSTHFFIFGDPHVVVDLGKNIKICFNWIGKDLAVYNLIHDKEQGITVNMKLGTVAIKHSKWRTFVQKIGFVFTKSNISLKMDGYGLVIKYSRDTAISILRGTERTLRKRGIHLQTVLNARNLFSYHIAYQGIEFEVMSHPKSGHFHMDFKVLNGYGFSQQTSGILGQFPIHKQTVPLLHRIPKSNRATLHYGSEMVLVSQFKYRTKKLRLLFQCWRIDDFHDLVGSEEEKFMLSRLLEIPNY